jgi:hypothetical protein
MSVRASSYAPHLILNPGVELRDATGTPSVLVGPDKVDLIVNEKFAAFDRVISVMSESGKKGYKVS